MLFAIFHFHTIYISYLWVPRSDKLLSKYISVVDLFTFVTWVTENLSMNQSEPWNPWSQFEDVTLHVNDLNIRHQLKKASKWRETYSQSWRSCNTL